MFLAKINEYFSKIKKQPGREWKIDMNSNSNDILITLDSINNEYWYNYIQSKFIFLNFI